MTPEQLAAKGVVRRGVHQMTRRVCHWPYCARCGLVALKNDASRKALRSDCVTIEDS